MVKPANQQSILPAWVQWDVSCHRTRYQTFGDEGSLGRGTTLANGNEYEADVVVILVLVETPPEVE
jgi:hypothetical protein